MSVYLCRSSSQRPSLTDGQLPGLPEETARPPQGTRNLPRTTTHILKSRSVRKERTMLKVKVIDVKRKVITWSESVSHALDDSKGQLKTGDRKSQLN